MVIKALEVLKTPKHASGSAWWDTHLVFAALTALKTGQDLTLDDLHPGVSFLIRSGFKMPRLTRKWYNDELKVLLLLCWVWEIGVGMKRVPQFPKIFFPAFCVYLMCMVKKTVKSTRWEGQLCQWLGTLIFEFFLSARGGDSNWAVTFYIYSLSLFNFVTVYYTLNHSNSTQLLPCTILIILTRTI